MRSPRRYFYLFVCFVGACFQLKGQGVCSSSALAPVYTQTFGTSTTSSKKNTVPSGFVTNYTFNGSSSLQDGQYMVTPLVQNSSNTDWAKGGDHTGNTNGNMFLVNAGTGASTFFYQQVDNLCPGSVYSFSAWLANVNTISNTKSICGSGLVWPKVTFNIKNTSGTILATYTTDTLPLTTNRVVSPNWKQYGFQFSLPSGTTSLILEMKDYYGGQPQCGNDLALDDILFSACTPTATAALSTSSTICAGTSTTMSCSLVNSPYTNPAYQWQKSTDGGTNWSNIGTPGTSAASYPIASAVIADGAMYRVVVGPDVSSLSSNTCITASNSITLTVNPSPAATVSSSSPLCSGNSLSLTAIPSGGTTPYTHAWSGPNSFSSTTQNPSIANTTTAATGTYSYTVTDSKGCSATATTAVTVNQTPVVTAISGGSTGGCVGTVINLSNATPGGTWNSSNPAVASVNSSGTVTIKTGGSALISYTVTNGTCSNSVTTTITGISVALHSDVIECNNGVLHFDATDLFYGVTYSNSNAGNTYNWIVSGGPFSFQGSSSASSQYPNMQFQTGYSYKTIVQFTSGGFTCSDTQMVYKNVVAADTIQGSKDTTVCFNTGPISISATASAVTNSFAWTSSGTGSFSPANTLNTTYTPSAADKVAGTIKLYLSGSSTFNANGNCGSSVAKDSMILRIYPDNTASNSTQTICSNQALNFTPVSAIPGSTFSWSSAVSSGSASGNSATGTGNITDSLVNPSNTVDAVVVYTITPLTFTPSNKTCTGTPFTRTVTVKPKPGITITNNAPAICTGSATNIQFTSSLSGSLYTWTSAVVSGSASGNSTQSSATATNSITNTLSNPAAVNATVRYYITSTSTSSCVKTDSTDVLVYALPSAANAGVDLAVCNASSTVLAASLPTSGSGTWTFVSGPSAVSFTNANSVTSGVTGLVPGTYLLQWTVTNGSCAASRDTVKLVNNSNTVAGSVTTSSAVCAGTNSGTLNLGGYTGSILRWESSTDGGSSWPTVINNTTSSYSFSNLATTTLFRAVVQNGNCAVTNATPATITVNGATVAGIVSADATVCSASNSGTLNLSGNTGNIIRWESSTNNGSTWNNIANTTTAYSYTNLTATTLFRAVVQNGVCGALNSNNATIAVTPVTVPGSVNGTATVCAGGNSGTLNLSGNTGSVLRWESSTDNGTTWSNIANTTNALSYSNLVATTIYRALVQSGACSSAYTNNVTITVLQAVTVANAGTDQALCNVTSATMAANTPVSGTGHWAAVAGNPTAVTFTNAASASTTVNGLVPGTYQFEWTVSNGICADSKDSIQVIVYPAAVPGTVTANATVCAGSNSGTLTLGGYSGNIVRWEFSTDNGSSWNNIANTSASQNYTNLSTTTKYRVAVQSGNCTIVYSNIATVTVLQAVSAANAGPDQQLCNVSSATMAANTPSSGTGTWTAVAGNPTAVTFTNAASAATTVNGLTVGTYQFVWTVSNGVCADSKDTVQVIVYPVSVPGTLSANATVCATANSGTLSLTGYLTNILRWESSTDNGTTWNNIANPTAAQNYNNLSASTKYRAYVQNAICPALYSNIVSITVLQAVTTANAGADQALC
ncbi:MAG: hypothetical protein JO301_02335, partial [Chitinophagaceae bacterium]|nr:hypothetical protein [Chitinophagaceae bacterium]